MTELCCETEGWVHLVPASVESLVILGEWFMSVLVKVLCTRAYLLYTIVTSYSLSSSVAYRYLFLSD